VLQAVGAVGNGFENSPAIYGWVPGSETPSPVPSGTKGMSAHPPVASVPAGTGNIYDPMPSHKWPGYFQRDYAFDTFTKGTVASTPRPNGERAGVRGVDFESVLASSPRPSSLMGGEGENLVKDIIPTFRPTHNRNVAATIHFPGRAMRRVVPRPTRERMRISPEASPPGTVSRQLSPGPGHSQRARPEPGHNRPHSNYIPSSARLTGRG